MTKRARWITIATSAVVVVLAAIFILWFTSENQRFHRLLDDVRGEGGVVQSVVVNNDGIRELNFAERATADEIRSVWRHMDAGDVSRVSIGSVDVDPYDMDVTMNVAVAAAEVRVPPARLAVREVGEDEVWLEAGFPRGREGVTEPRPADGAAVVVPILEKLQSTAVPDELYLVAAHRITKQLDLVLVERSALRHLDATIASLRRVAATDPDHAIRCDVTGCTAG